MPTPTGPLEVTVIDRYVPLVTAACGTRVARQARTTMLTPGGDGSQLAQRVRPILGDPPPRGQELGGLPAAGVGRPELNLLSSAGEAYEDRRSGLSAGCSIHR